MNLVDLVAILPFYIGLIMRAFSDGGSATGSLSFVRVSRPHSLHIFVHYTGASYGFESAAVEALLKPAMPFPSILE
jgi:hypothetical protein